MDARKALKASWEFHKRRARCDERCRLITQVICQVIYLHPFARTFVAWGTQNTFIAYPYLSN